MNHLLLCQRACILTHQQLPFSTTADGSTRVIQLPSQLFISTTRHIEYLGEMRSYTSRHNVRPLMHSPYIRAHSSRRIDQRGCLSLPPAIGNTSARCVVLVERVNRSRQLSNNGRVVGSHVNVLIEVPRLRARTPWMVVVVEGVAAGGGGGGGGFARVFVGCMRKHLLGSQPNNI
jgi:hypothetical protein